MKKIKLSDVLKKHAVIVGWLLGSWVLALGSAYLLKKPELVGLAPVLNYIGYAIQLELKKEGYIKVLQK